MTAPQRNARYWIEKLKLEPHPEGGYYRQTYKSDLLISADSLPTHSGPRAASTAIYFLLEAENFSAFHRLRSDELWHFYAGSSLLVHVIDQAGAHSTLLLGDNPDARQTFQAVVPAAHWFASHVADWNSWALVGCTASPGFDFADLELGDPTDLIRQHPQHETIIRRLTRSHSLRR